MRADALYGVILAGGGGARLWPVSREQYPKQFLKLGGKDSLFQRTVRRLGRVVPLTRICVVANQDIGLEVKAQLASMSRTGRTTSVRILREPFGRNTAAAAGVAAIVLNEIDPAAVMAVLPADHLIQNETKFAQLLKMAARYAAEGNLVTFGIRPTHPETGYGYIQSGRRRPLQTSPGGIALDVARFVEKPDHKTARAYLARGGFYWNSGIFVWKVSVLLEEIRKHLPKLYAGLQEIRRALNTRHEEDVLKKVYSRIDAISIDYGVMEKSRQTVMVPADMGWSDVGDWASVYRLSRQGKNSNRTEGQVMTVDTKRSMILSPRRLTAAVGVRDLFVVDTPDALLICGNTRAQEVKTVVDQLKSRRSEVWRLPNLVRRPWGTYEVLQTSPSYQVKRIVLNPGAAISLQLHRRRSEHWVVVSGEARVTHGTRKYILRTNESAFIPPKTKHALANRTKNPLVIIEVQSGNYLGEDDIVRFEDRYGRCDLERPLTTLPGGLP